jgi:alkylation response protein AidB-like acyl-CoA dehydrogenase
VFDLSVTYSRERSQFGQTIGRFQRVQDHIIHIVNYLDAARWTTYEALWKLDSGIDAASSVHMAKSVASESYMRACDFGHEVHAGIGVMREYGLTLHTKMSRSLYHCLGSPKDHRRRLEHALGLVTS